MTDQEPDETDLVPPGDTPLLGRESFYCPRCRAFAHQEWIDLRMVKRVGTGLSPAVDTKEGFVGVVVDEEGNRSAAYSGDPDSAPPGKTGRWRFARCSKCENHSVWRDDRMIYPAGSTVAPPSHADMPPEARELYDEAREVVGISRRAGAALARASLERLLKSVDQMTGRPSLEDRIEHILPKVSDGLADMLTVIRHAGNKSLHVEDQPDDVMVLILDPEETEIVEMIFTAVNNAVEELITRPRKTSGLFSKVPEAVRKKIEAARAESAARADES